MVSISARNWRQKCCDRIVDDRVRGIIYLYLLLSNGMISSSTRKEQEGGKCRKLTLGKKCRLQYCNIKLDIVSIYKYINIRLQY